MNKCICIYICLSVYIYYILNLRLLCIKFVLYYIKFVIRFEYNKVRMEYQAFVRDLVVDFDINYFV